MKNATIVLGFITGLSITTADLFKFTHLLGARFLLFSTGILIALFAAVFILDKMKETDGRRFPSHVAGALSALFVNLGVTARINHWQGADLWLTIGLLCFSGVFVPLLLYQKSKVPGANHWIELRNSAMQAFHLSLTFMR